MKTALVLILATAFSLAPFGRDTNSRAAAKRAMKAFAKRDYASAVADFRTADGIARTPLRDFNLGTAQVAAGVGEEGSTLLTSAMRDPKLREAALFNRGNAALAAKAFDYAIRDYSAALRLRPDDPAAKRNLEIALQRKAQEDQQKQPGGKGQQQPQPQPQPSPSPQNPQAQPKGNADLEALLRSVQQQEQEELARMRAQRTIQGHVGW